MSTRRPRQVKTPAQRAQEAVGVLERRLVKLRAKNKDLDEQVKTVRTEIGEVEKRLAYARKHPDLPTNPGGPITGPSTTRGDNA